MKIDIKKLPPLKLIDTDVGEIEKNMIASFESKANRTLYPGDPIRLMIEPLAKTFAIQREAFEDSIRQGFLAYARREKLDRKGDYMETDRIPASKAMVKVIFALSMAQSIIQIIPIGTRVSAGDGIYFETTEATIIPIGTTDVEITMTATEAGEKHNGFVAGQIRELVDPIPWVQSVVNVTTSNGGAEIEDDNRYRERIHMAPESFSSAGPSGAYRALVMKTHQNISDVEAWRPSEGVVELIPLMKNGELPSEEILSSIVICCSARDKRPLTDHVRARAPEFVGYEIDCKYWICEDDLGNVAYIQSKVAKTLEEYQMWQKERLGRDINPSELIRRIQSCGVKRVEVISPVFTKLERWQIAKETQVKCEFMGTEYE